MQIFGKLPQILEHRPIVKFCREPRKTDLPQHLAYRPQPKNLAPIIEVVGDI